MTITDPGTIEVHLSGQLRQIVLLEIAERQVSTETLAERIDVMPFVLTEVLDRPNWSIRIGLVLAQALDIPVDDLLRRLGAAT